ncbi:MAG: 3-phosphoshikimate 1-carboxyvinyltransferase [Hyphomonas sp.]
MVWTSRPVKSLKGAVRAPGDKSCSHRALIFGGLAEGTSRFTGMLEGDDVLRTGAAMSALGADVKRLGGGAWEVTGVGARGLSSPQGILDFGNSGTGSRLMMGVMAGHDLTAELTGDKSLCSRPMNRILNPLRQMGLTDTAGPDGRLPFSLTGTKNLQAITYAPPQASAQVKSAVLLAGLSANGTTIVEEAKPTRDHTERMLRGFGVEVGVQRKPGEPTRISIKGGQTLRAIEAAIPGDPSSAAFLVAAGILSPASDVQVDGVMSNPTRSGFYDVANLMGAHLGAEEAGEARDARSISPRAMRTSKASMCRTLYRLHDRRSHSSRPRRLCRGRDRGHRPRSAGEGSDRIDATVAMLRANGVEAEGTPDGFIVQGCAGKVPGGGLVETHHDHRIAMSALVMGTAAQNPVSVDDISMIATSYPEFLAHMATLGADLSEE